jgi:hypothetical protein
MLGQRTCTLSPVFSLDAIERARFVVSVRRTGVRYTDQELVSDLGFRVGVRERYEAIGLELCWVTLMGLDRVELTIAVCLAEAFG